MNSRYAALAAMVVMLTSCAAAARTVKTPWKLELSTSGGFAGKGNGAIAIASDGAVTVTTMERKECTFTADADAIGRFTDLLAQSRPATWDDSYAPENRCCDRFEYVLTLTEGAEQTRVEWIDSPLPMPKDLAALTEGVLAELRTRSAECRSRQQ